MTPEMHEALYELSLLYDPDPIVIFRRVVDIVSEFYNGTMAMLNMLEGDRIVCRVVSHPHPALRNFQSLRVDRTYCIFALRAVRPLLVQDAKNDPEFCNHPAVRVGLGRYLGVPVSTPAGEPIGTLCFVDDKIDEKLQEHDVRFLSLLAMRASAELERERMVKSQIEEHRRMAEQTAEFNARLQATAEEKRRFVAMVIHDLRHPLTTLRTVLYMAKSETDPEQIASYMDVMENRVLALNSLLNELVQYNEIEAGRILLNIEKTDIRALIEECVSGFAPAFVGQTVRLETEIEEPIGTADTDAGKLMHILLNLLSNALKFTTQGTVRVRAQSEGAENWVLEVEDTGIGMSAEEQERVFEEFYRTPAAQEAQPGSGLGLAIVKQFTGVMHGTLLLEGAPGKGTRIRITFPRCLTM